MESDEELNSIELVRCTRVFYRDETTRLPKASQPGPAFPDMRANDRRFFLRKWIVVADRARMGSSIHTSQAQQRFVLHFSELPVNQNQNFTSNARAHFTKLQLCRPFVGHIHRLVIVCKEINNGWMDGWIALHSC